VGKPFTFIIDVIRDELAQIPVAVVDPFPGVHSWLDKNKGLVYKTVEFLKRAVLFL
jgi:hypothetical protein